MNKYKKFFVSIMIVEMILAALCNGLYFYRTHNSSGRLYRVEAKRIAAEIEEQNLTKEDVETLDLSSYDTVVGVSEFLPDETCRNDYVVEKAGGRLYRIEYRADEGNGILLYMNISLLGAMILTDVVLCYIYRKVLKPFHTMSDLTYELAKGNLSMPVKEEKSRAFGRFLWGMDMLREKLEDNRKRELELQREKKTLVLSLSHDIKTPLSSIELYARALSENLYEAPEKKEEALRGIRKNVGEIRKYVEEIVTASREDFMNLEVENGECYLREIIAETERCYRDRLAVLHTEFTVEEFPECLIKGDKNRLIEVLQNLMENAVKYGDGKYIRIYGGEEEDCELVHIENSGNSLKAEELPNLFDSFYRGGNSRGIKGNGLGLYIGKTLMRKMDGDAYAEVSDGIFRATAVMRKA